MKRLIAKALLQLYPRAWRERYRDEVATLIDDAPSAWNHTPSLFLEAMRMQWSAPQRKGILACATAGLLVASGIAWRMPDRYESTAVMRLKAKSGDEKDAEEEVIRLQRLVLSRTSLARLIRDAGIPSLRAQMNQEPMEDIIDELKRERVRIMIQPRDVAISIQFRGDSPEAARRGVAFLTHSFTSEHAKKERVLQYIEEDAAKDGVALPSARTELTVLDGPSNPARPEAPRRFLIAMAGVAAGLALALVALIVRRRSRVWLSGALSVFALAFATNFIAVLPYESGAVIVCDSPSTAQTISEKARAILNPKEGMFSPLSIRVYRDQIDIRTTGTSRFLAQQSAHRAVSTLVDLTIQTFPRSDRAELSVWQGPWTRVVDPPSLGVFPMGSAIRGGLLWSSLVIALLSAGWIVRDRFRRDRFDQAIHA